MEGWERKEAKGEKNSFLENINIYLSFPNIPKISQILNEILGNKSRDFRGLQSAYVLANKAYVPCNVN